MANAAEQGKIVSESKFDTAEYTQMPLFQIPRIQEYVDSIIDEIFVLTVGQEFTKMTYDRDRKAHVTGWKIVNFPLIPDIYGPSGGYLVQCESTGGSYWNIHLANLKNTNQVTFSTYM